VEYIIDIFRLIFEKTLNLQVHCDCIKLMVDYFNSIKEKLFNESFSNILSKNIFNLVQLLHNCLKPYSDVPEEKFKFADVMKDPKELEKKIKTPKLIKCEVREKTLLYLKNLLVKNPLFYESTIRQDQNDNSKIARMMVKGLFEVFSKPELLKTIVNDNEQNRLLFIDTFVLFLSKFYMIENLSGNINKFANISEIKVFLPNLEEYFSFEIYDKNTEVSKKAFTIFNFMLQLYPLSEFYSSISKTFLFLYF